MPTTPNGWHGTYNFFFGPNLQKLLPLKFSKIILPLSSYINSKVFLEKIMRDAKHQFVKLVKKALHSKFNEKDAVSRYLNIR